jgi:hypothetical protein
MQWRVYVLPQNEAPATGHAANKNTGAASSSAAAAGAMLPLKKGAKVAVLGPQAFSRALFGDYSNGPCAQDDPVRKYNNGFLCAV